MRRFNTAQFTWSASCGTFVTEASDVRFNPNTDMGRIYLDACDVGIVLVSNFTGTEAVYFFEREDLDREGDISAWVFLPTNETVRKLPHLQHTSVIIFND